MHCPLTPETKGLIGKDEIAKMRSGTYILNTARGGIVQEVRSLSAVCGWQHARPRCLPRPLCPPMCDRACDDDNVGLVSLLLSICVLVSLDIVLLSILVSLLRRLCRNP